MSRDYSYQHKRRAILDVSIMEIKNPLARFNLTLWQQVTEYLVALSATAALFAYRLHTLVPGFSLPEREAIAAAASLKTIGTDPLFLPHKFLQYLGLKLDHNGFIAMRLPSVLAGLIAAGLFFYVINKWFNLRIAAITTLLLVTSSWFLQLARVGIPEITYLGILAPLAYAVWLPNYKRPIIALGLGAVVLINTLYTPGLIWFTLIGFVWQRKTVAKLFREARIPALFTLSACVMLLTPLLLAFVRSPELIEQYIGLPAAPLEALKELPKNLALIPYHLVLRGEVNPLQNLGNLPLLDFFTVIMAILGGYSYATYFGLRRSRMILGSLVLSCLLVALQGSVTLAILLPFVYLLVAGGLNFMIEQWFMVFPYNPLARGLAVILIVGALGATTFYHLNRYFVAWPQAPATRAVYDQPHR